MSCSRLIPVLLVSAVSFGACAPGDSPADPLSPAFGMGGAGHAQCVPFSASGTTFASGPYQFSGSAEVRIGSSAPVPASVTTYLTGTIKQSTQGSGTQVVTTSHVFDLGDGDTFVTEDIARLVPTRTPGVLRLLSTLRIVQGTGAFAGVPQHPNPRFVGEQDGVMDLTAAPPTATWSFSSKLCGYGG